MFKNEQSYKCQNCHKLIPISEQNTHKSICKPHLNTIKNKSSSKKSNKNFEKLEEDYENQFFNPFSFECRGQTSFTAFCLSLNSYNSINPDEVITENGLSDLKNLNSNNSIDLPRLDNNNLFSMTGFEIFSSFNYNPVDPIFLDNLIVNKITKKGIILESDCIICLQKYQMADNYISLPCFHNYHENCIKNWLKRKNFCPLCKHVFSVNDLL